MGENMFVDNPFIACPECKGVGREIAERNVMAVVAVASVCVKMYVQSVTMDTPKGSTITIGKVRKT